MHSVWSPLVLVTSAGIFLFINHWQGGVSCISGTLLGVSGAISDLNNSINIMRYSPYSTEMSKLYKSNCSSQLSE